MSRSALTITALPCLLLAAVGSLVTAPNLWAQAAPPTLSPGPAGEARTAPLEEVVVTAPEPRWVAPTTRDQIGRIWAPVLINGKGPYRLVLDTGATRSAVIRRVVDEVGLPLQPDAVILRGVTGSAVVSAVKAETLEFGDLLVEGTTMPIVADAFGGADGVLGGEGMRDKRIQIEFLRDRISIARSRRAPAPAGFVVLPFKHSYNRGLRIYIKVGSIRTVAVIDTGAQVTVGNFALREALVRRRGQRDQFDDSVIGVTEDIQHATRVRIPDIVAGELLVSNTEVMFSDLHIFEYWGLTTRPALIIGMDVLGTLDTLVIDYRLNELHLRLKR